MKKTKKPGIFQRGNTYTYVVDIGRDPVTGKRIQKTKDGFKTLKEAEAARRKIQLEVDENRYLEPSNEIFSTYVEHWFNTHYQKR